MAKWRELGEVPDSDDESALESQEPPPDPEPSVDHDDHSTQDDTPNGAVSASPTRAAQDVWDIPFSSQSSATPQDEAREPTDPLPLPRSSCANENTSAYRSDVSSPLSSLHDELEGKEPDTGNVLGPDPPPGSGQPAGPNRSPSDGPEDLPSADTDDLDTFHLKFESGQLGRSLRPRKPIQEHPYLLESVQYSKTWKSHGLRPMRVQIEEAIRKKRQEEDSQEQDYEEDSQHTNKETAQYDTEESQGARLFGSNDDVDELALSPVREASGPAMQGGMQHPSSSLGATQDEEEFPDPADIDKWKVKRGRGRPRKRQASPKTSWKQKFPRTGVRETAVSNAPPSSPHFQDPFDIPLSPPQTSPALLAITPMVAAERSIRRPVVNLTPKPSSSVSSRVPTPATTNQNTDTIDLTAVDDEEEDQLSSDQAMDSGSGSDSASDTARVAVTKRMRGVLPASWLRLDQRKPEQKKTIPDRSPEVSPDRSHRKGVAQRRQVSPGPNTAAAMFFEDSDDDDGMNGPLGGLEDASDPSDPIPIFDDDAESIVEEDHIDRMIPSRKRANAGVGRPPAKRRKSQQATFKGIPSQSKRQQRITGLIGYPKAQASASSRSKDSRLSKNSVSVGRPRADPGARQIVTPAFPRLSIIDVADPEAPAFVRIAARTAKKRRDKGRASPTRKRIVLGSRKDNTDVADVMRRWEVGDIRPRAPSIPASLQDEQLPARPLQSISNNAVIQLSTVIPAKTKPARVVSLARFPQPARIPRQISIDDFVSTRLENSASDSRVRDRPVGSKAGAEDLPSRPAQLETADLSASRQTFYTGKKTLDALYRKSRKHLSSPADIRLEKVVGVDRSHVVSRPSDSGTSTGTHDVRHDKPATTRRRLRRKQHQPRLIDTTAPQIVCANDPITRHWSPPPVATDVTQISDKLLGLGSFGVHYTRHFEIFPLDPGVYFHESTPIGMGRLVKALEQKSFESPTRPSNRQTFVLGEKTSSEFGIVFDWLSESLCESRVPEPATITAVQAVDFILDYLQNSMSFTEPGSEKLFCHRVAEVIRGFEQRIRVVPAGRYSQTRSLIEVLTRVLILLLHTWCIARRSDNFTDVDEIEKLLKCTATTAIRTLLQTNLEDVRNLGIRSDQYSISCWVTLIRIFEETRIPRSSFWDIVSPILLGNGLDSCVDTHRLEQMWRSLFILLPLGEFDNGGLVCPGTRHTSPLEGWSIPQKLLRRVFHLYQSNSRQSPSFNEYCRALVSRCHYLVEHWGWRKGNATIGLRNLRNEEVDQSPQFLENLAGSPSLEVLRGDRCFHIFLKLLALSIKQLGKFQLTKDVRNLVARESTVHETELAALRNHHDLLSTLFWAAPRDLRPSVQRIEELVVPGSSHKAACLISLRAWSQLARFIVSSSADISAYRPFADWQRSIFQQIVDQYSSIEADVQQQLSKMSKAVDQNWKNVVINSNKTAAMNIIHLSMGAFLEVLHHTASLDAASYIVNCYPLDQAFARLPFSSAGSDLGTLRAALDILDFFLSRIERAGQQRLEDGDQAHHEEDAIMLLERKLAMPYFTLVRDLVSFEPENLTISRTHDRRLCVERAVSIAGRQAVRLIHARLSGVSQFFSDGKYRIFPNPSKHTDAPARRFQPIFLAILIGENDLGTTRLELFLGEIVKPYKYFAYENRLATAMKLQGDPLLKGAIIDAGKSPDYDSNRDLFSATVTAMRRALRFAEQTERQLLKKQFSKSLQGTMDRMKLDLKSLTLDSLEHLNHVEFVRSIVSIIRSQDIYPVDTYFYEINREYSPSCHDPRLQTASILSWGVKLEEGETRAVSGLFYLLFPSFRLALANGQLHNEKVIILQAMEHPHVFFFILGKMIPAIVKSIYTEALHAHLSGDGIHEAIGMVDLLMLVKSVSAAVKRFHDTVIFELRPEHIFTLTLMTRILNLISPSITACLINNPDSDVAHALASLADAFTGFARTASEYLAELMAAAEGSTPEPTTTVDPDRLFRGEGPPSGMAPGPGSGPPHEIIDSFASHMAKDMRDNWVTDGPGGAITVRGPSPRGGPAAAAAAAAAPGGTQSGRGIPTPTWDVARLVRDLYEQLRAWSHANHANDDYDKATGATWATEAGAAGAAAPRGRRVRDVLLGEDFCF
ncbi:Mus7/MMS22 family-domain-containing protein [Xylariaceae sp. FL0804]|nr:Mus7/MMS22 family-domain-containing protein [Xylariaceae sp. FL0804]